MQSIAATPRHTTAPLTPDSSITKSTPRKSFAYVAVPPLPKAFQTPLSARSGGSSRSLSVSTKQFGKLKVDDTPDLGGYGSEEDDSYSPTRGDSVSDIKSSARRTGDRDDRGTSEEVLLRVYSHISSSTTGEIDRPARRHF
jgi:cohesin loading factor subunit SCC2